jgi:hypothetical protein
MYTMHTDDQKEDGVILFSLGNKPQGKRKFFIGACPVKPSFVSLGSICVICLPS